MKVAIYNPYLDTAGGGDKYMMIIAELLARTEEVEVLLDQHLWSVGVEGIKERLKNSHGLDLSKMTFRKAPIGFGSSFIKRIIFLKQYDWLFYLTDGSIFLSTAKNSVLHFQMPLDDVAVKGLWGQIKLRSWKEAIYNSKFTKDYIEKMVKIPGKIVYPPVDIEHFGRTAKKKQILTVGRFSAHTKSKKHDLMIKVFKEMVIGKKITGWSLHLAGGMMEGDREYVDQLREEVKGYNIYLYPDIPIKQLTDLYEESSIYWHAAGFGEDDPKKTEHFGITTVEAMAAGCIPVVINKGGQPEIVEDGKNGFLWNEIDELKSKTLKLMKDSELRSTLAMAAKLSSVQFSKKHFEEEIKNIVGLEGK